MRCVIILEEEEEKKEGKHSRKRKDKKSRSTTSASAPASTSASSPGPCKGSNLPRRVEHAVGVRPYLRGKRRENGRRRCSRCGATAAAAGGDGGERAGPERVCDAEQRRDGSDPALRQSVYRGRRGGEGGVGRGRGGGRVEQVRRRRGGRGQCGGGRGERELRLLVEQLVVRSGRRKRSLRRRRAHPAGDHERRRSRKHRRRGVGS